MTTIYLATMVLVWISHQCAGLTSCRDKSLTINNAKVIIRYEEILQGKVENFKLYARINWTVSGTNDEDFDGFLVRITQTQNYDHLKPFDDCEASLTQVWLKTEDCVRRENKNGSKCPVDLEMGGSFCPCDKDNCPAFQGISCSGTPSMLKDHRLRRYLAIPNTRRSVLYQIEFNTAYTFEMYLYRRQFVSSKTKYKLPANWFCADTVAAAFGLGLPAANQKCCLSNASAIAPVDLQRGELVLDRATNTLNLTVSWIPPAPNELLTAALAGARPLSVPPSCDSKCQPETTYPETEGDIDESEKCALDNRRQTATVYNLLPNLDYEISAASTYGGPLWTTCRQGKCGIRLRVRTDFDPCDTKWTNCKAGFHCVIIDGGDEILKVAETICEPDELNTTNLPSTSFSDHSQRSLASESATGGITSGTKLTAVNESQGASSIIQGSCASISEYCDKNAVCVMQHSISKPSCSCSDGLVGNGINITYGGSGCTGCPLTTKCDTMATCIAADQPSDGFFCRCDDAYYGDGLKSGSGCSSRARRTATIVVPLVLCGILLLIVVIWCMCHRRKPKFRTGRPSNLLL